MREKLNPVPLSDKKNKNAAKIVLLWLTNWFTEVAAADAQQVPLRIRRQKTIDGCDTVLIQGEVRASIILLHVKVFVSPDENCRG